jgi:NitT/TauT family transport system ATP-binding protein
MRPPLIVRGVGKVFHQTVTGRAVVAIDHLDLEIPAGQIVAIVGRTGCGKSTFLHVVLGLETPSAGEVSIGGQTPYGDFEAFRGQVAAVFQEDRLLPWRTALENARLGLELVGRAREESRAVEWLLRLGLGERLGAYPGELSGGMRQRVAIARALAIQPKLLLADEAFGHLDEVTAAALRRTFVELARAEHITTILVTHQIEEAIEAGDRVLVFGVPGRVLADIEHPRDHDPRELRVEIQRLIDRGDDLRPSHTTTGGAGEAVRL